ncbi:unnamed protein product, partial [Coccothraustes coccothraustes]
MFNFFHIYKKECEGKKYARIFTSVFILSFACMTRNCYWVLYVYIGIFMCSYIFSCRVALVMAYLNYLATWETLERV